MGLPELPNKLVLSAVRQTHHYTLTSASGEIGRHAALRGLCRKVWRFKSSLAHQNKEIGLGRSFCFVFLRVEVSFRCKTLAIMSTC
jgi:hypothetical protein